jgi:undecaprenyl-diphosphatase
MNGRHFVLSIIAEKVNFSLGVRITDGNKAACRNWFCTDSGRILPQTPTIVCEPAQHRYRLKEHALLRRLSKSLHLTITVILLLLIPVVFLIRRSGFYPSISDADIALLEFFNRNRVSSLDRFFMAITDATTFISIGIMLALFFTAWRRRSARMLHKGLQLGLTLLSVLAVVSGVKYAIMRQRPFEVHDFIQKLSGGGGPSFPSGHTTEVFAVTTAMFVMFPEKKWPGAILLAWACMVGYTRMLLGVHYPSDIIGGMLFGILTALIIHLIYNREGLTHEPLDRPMG